MQIQVSEATAALRRIPVYMVDVTDGFTPETGLSGTAVVTVDKNGAGFGASGGTLTEIANGFYYYEATAGELDTLGALHIRVTHANIRDFPGLVQVVAYDPYTAASSGYDDGAVWLSAGSGTAGTIVGVNGVKDLPSNTIADTLTIAVALGLRRIRLATNTDFVMPSPLTGYSFVSDDCEIDLNGQAVAACHFEGCFVYGICTGAFPRFVRCEIGDVTLPRCDVEDCRIYATTITLGEASLYSFYRCTRTATAVGDTGFTLEFGAGIGSTRVNMLDLHSDMIVANLGTSGTDVLNLSGSGALTLAASCAGGTVNVFGNWTITDLSGGAVVVNDGARFAVSNLPTGVSATGAVNTTANSDSTITTGSAVAGTYASTVQLDGTPWQIDDAAGTLDMYCEFQVGGNGSPISVTMTGRVNSANDSLNVYARNFSGGGSWEQIGTLNGQGGSVDKPHTYSLFATHVGTGADLGKVRIRFQAAGLTAADLYIDQIFCSYATVGATVGYANGAIWIDTLNGTAGTEVNVNGTADNPSLTLADAITLNTSMKLNQYHIAPGSSITLTQAFDNFVFTGDHWTLALGGQSIASAVICGANVTGVCTAATSPHFDSCDFGAATLPASHLHLCGLEGRITASAAGDYHLNECYDEGGAEFDFGGAVGATALQLAHYSGDIEIFNMGQAGADTMRLEGHGELVCAASCIGGTVSIRGHFPVTDNSTGAGVTFSEDARFSLDALASAHGAGSWTAASGFATPTNVTDARDAILAVGSTGPWTIGGMSASQSTWLQEMWRAMSLDSDNPRVDNTSSVTIGGITITVATAGTQVTTTRTP